MPRPTKRQTWNNLDVFGLLNGLAIWDEQYKSLKYVRKPYETGLDIRRKIYSSHDYPSDVTRQGIINGLSVEFDLEPYNVENKSVFTLSRNPVPSGGLYTQDIFAYYKTPESSNWKSLGPQVWPNTYTTSKANGNGFIVWQNEQYSNISGYKNYTYTNLVEVLRKDLDDKTQLKFEYYIYISDNLDNRKLVKFTDMNNQVDPYDHRYTYRKCNNSPSLSGIVVYTLNDIPDNIKYDKYYYRDTSIAKDYLYNIKTHIDSKFNHSWEKLYDNSSIWDAHLEYGSGDISHFYDAIAPNNVSLSYSGLTGGIEELSYSLYPSEITESGTSYSWYLKLFPGRFYVEGIPFYFFENVQKDYITFSSGVANLPSGLQRGMYTIMALSGFYNSYVNVQQDRYLTNVFEDYNYNSGPDGNILWKNIYRKRPYVSSSMGHSIQLDLGEYNIDWENNLIYSELPSGYSNAVIIWDNTLIPSGTVLPYDINPVNDQYLIHDKFFIYMGIQ